MNLLNRVLRLLKKMNMRNEVMVDDENYSPEQRKAAYEDKQYLDKILEAQRAEAYH